MTAENWTAQFTGLPEFENGTKIVYTIKELDPSGAEVEDKGAFGEFYTATYSEDKLTVTNKHEIIKKDIEVTKNWNDENNQDGFRPTNVVYQLYKQAGANGEKVKVNKTVTLTGDKTADSWTAKFEKLDVYEGGVELIYSIVELDAEGNELAVDDDLDDYYTVESYGEDGLSVTNKHVPETTELTVIKVWVDNGNQDGFRPETLTVTLKGNGEEVGTVTLSDDNDWTDSIADLPVYADQKKITYQWVEEDLSDLDYSIVSIVTDEETGLITTITNEHTPEETSATVIKVWDDKNDQDGLQPDTLTVTLLADGEPVMTEPENEDEEPVPVTVVLSAENKWTATVKHLPKRVDGELITYSWDEGTITGYTLLDPSVEGQVTTLTNQHTPEKTEISVEKVWEDAEDQDGIRPEKIKVNLLADGKVIESYDLVASEDWKHTFSGLDKYRDHGVEIEYTVEEPEDAIPEGYKMTQEGNVITNTHEPATVEVPVEKVWDDADNQDGIRPEKIKVNLLADGEVIDSYELKEDEEWKHTFKELPKFKIVDGKGGIEIKYTVEEPEDAIPEGYEMTQEGNVITNTHKPEVTTVTVEKVWEDDDNNDGFRPEKITVSLLADGEKIRQLTLSDENEWTETVEGLPKFKVGKVGQEVKYTFEEEIVSRYEVTYSEIKDGKITITNTHDNELIEIPVEKVWVGDADFQVIRPEKIEVVLLADGKEFAKAELSYENEWKHTFDKLEKYADGKEIDYTVKEVEVPAGYKSEISGSKTDGYKITNTFTPISFDPPVMKEVVGDEADSSDTFTFKFTAKDGAPMPAAAEGASEMTVELKAGEEHEFGDVYLIEPGTYEYTITEVNDGKEGYAYDETEYVLVFEITTDENNQLVCNLTINGEAVDYKNLEPSTFKFVNEYREYVDVEVKKVWDDKENAEGKRPEEIEVTLYANDEVVEKVVLNEENGWTYKWEGLEYSDEEYNEISYTVKEDKVPEGYTMSHQQSGYVITITNTITPPETGDSNNLKLWATLMTLSMTSSVALAGVALKKKKEEEE